MTLKGATLRRADILVAADSPENIDLLAGMLTQKGYRIRAVPSGTRAIEAAEAEAPDLILLDISMPQLDGYEVCRRLKQNQVLAGIPVIFLSAMSETLDKVKAFSMGGVDYVTKPFHVEEISARIETHLSIRRLQLQLEQSHRELQRSYEKLQELGQVRQALIQMVVHDLKNPLTAIRANAGVIQEEGGLPGDLAVAIGDIVNLSKVMSRMVLDVLDVTRTDDAVLQPRFAPVDLRGLFQEVVSEVRGIAQSCGKVLIAGVAEDVPQWIIGDRELLRRLIENLLDNSFKYAPPGTEVRVEAQRAGAVHYTFHIRDRGPGVPEPYRQKIFEPYARLERDLEAGACMSRGLGLAFCRLAAQAHRGQIWVEDNPPAGSLFVVRLPVDPPAEVAADERLRVSGPLG